MESFETGDVVRSFRASPNLNAAIKNFLKREVRRGDAGGRFVKDFKGAMLGRNDAQAERIAANTSSGKRRRLSRLPP